jgi:Tfp pilus assembly protein PilN
VKRSQLGIILSLFAVFGSGIVVGAFGYHSYTAKTVNATVRPPAKKDTPEEWRRKYIHELQTKLNLDDKQLAQLNAVLDETRERFKALKEHQKQETEEVRASHTERVRAMLRPEQLPQYQKFRDEREQKIKEQAAKEKAAKEASK